MKLVVLMSVYNEIEEHLDNAIDSILHQSFGNFHFYIVNDNPANEEIDSFLSKYSSEDKITIVKNEENLGLAMSMNKAFRLAKAQGSFDYVARMDADDIALSNRFAKQLEMMKQSKADVCYTLFSLINENGEKIDETVEFVTDDLIKGVLPHRSCIHHPTVMIKAESFDMVGGYRDFPCAQDYDLWLRMLDKNMNFTSLPQELLEYRIRESSVSRKSSMKQEVTMMYARKMHKERIKNGKDQYSKDDYNNYLKKYDAINPNGIENYNTQKEKQTKALNKIRGKNPFGIFGLVSSMIHSKLIRDKFTDGLMYRLKR